MHPNAMFPPTNTVTGLIKGSLRDDVFFPGGNLALRGQKCPLDSHDERV